ncbi:MAG: hypothetical protein JKY54_09355, partial [Flavobacteriales bacterium]|nr:hypothetical protein [Flavobacteriales bacterium]
SSTDVITSCFTYTWLDSIVYTASNSSATITLTSTSGCDSVITLNLTILNSATGIDSQTTCDSLIWIDGNTYYSDNNTATFNLLGGAANSCDSLITLDLTVVSVSATLTQVGTLLTANVTGASYQWLECPGMTQISGATNQSYTAVVNGDYAVIVTANGCSNTSGCYTVTGVGIIENNFGNGLLFYPNPTNGKFSVDLGDNYESVTITMSDINGKVI